ncbi:MAG: hypothetical protein WC061_08100 [Melioribacteraceae bacterium]
MNNTIDRKSFFSMLGKGSVAAAIASVLPVKFLTAAVNSSDPKKVKIEIHPSAVKRNEKV